MIKTVIFSIGELKIYAIVKLKSSAYLLQKVNAVPEDQNIIKMVNITANVMQKSNNIKYLQKILK